MPFERHGVPQQRSGRSAGKASVTPARRQICSKDSRTPGPASLGPNIVPTQAVKYTASAVTPVGAASTAGAGSAAEVGRLVSGALRTRLAPPPGSSDDHSGRSSGSITLRPNRFAPTTALAG